MTTWAEQTQEAVARKICKSGKFETGQGTCAAICMDQLGEARRMHSEPAHSHSDRSSESSCPAPDPTPSPPVESSSFSSLDSSSSSGSSDSGSSGSCDSGSSGGSSGC